MNIYLVQHGQAKSEDIDPDKHLTEKGVAYVKKMSNFSKDTGLHVDVIWHSGKVRAVQTADILAQGVVSAQGVTQHKGILPNDDVRPIRDELLQSRIDVMIVGHLPFLNRLCSLLITGRDFANIFAFWQGGAVCLAHSEDKTWQVCCMVIPELL
jgi:phosphohistidine phosphatase